MGFLPPVVATLIADTKEYTAKMDAAQIKMGELGVEAETTGGKLSSFANKAATGIVAAGVAAAVLSAKMATDFQSSMTLLVTGAGEAQKNIEMVSQGILAMAGTVGQTPKALADGMYLIESAGYHAAAGLTVLKAAAEGAAVGNAQLTTVAGALTTVMHDYNIPVSKANQVTSALIETVASGKTHLEDLGASLGNVIPTAATLGVSLAQVGAGMAVQTNAGMSARLAAMHLNATMLALAAPNKIAASTMDAFGLSAQKLTETMADPRKGLGVALQMMVDAVGSKFPKGSAEYVAALKAMAGGTVGLQTILDLTGTHAKEFATDATNIGKRVNGASKEVQGFALVQKDLKFQLESLKGSASSLAISFGQFMLPKLSTVAGWAAKVFSLFTGKSIFSKIADDSVIAIFVAAVALKLGKAVKGISTLVQKYLMALKPLLAN
jgi:TP901 family phage tail tape measure protein